MFVTLEEKKKLKQCLIDTQRINQLILIKFTLCLTHVLEIKK